MDINLLNSLSIKDGKLEFLDTYIQESDDKMNTQLLHY